MGMGRLTLYTDEISAEILERLSAGEPLAQICRDEGMPRVRTVSDWKRAHPEFGLAFADARDDGYDAIAADCLRIADTPLPGTIEKFEWVLVDGDPTNPAIKPKREWRCTERRVEDMIAHRKLQIETRLKLLAKWDPRRYGDRLALNHSGSLTLEQLVGRAVEKTPAAEIPA